MRYRKDPTCGHWEPISEEASLELDIHDLVLGATFQDVLEEIQRRDPHAKVNRPLASEIISPEDQARYLEILKGSPEYKGWHNWIYNVFGERFEEQYGGTSLLGAFEALTPDDPAAWVPRTFVMSKTWFKRPPMFFSPRHYRQHHGTRSVAKNSLLVEFVTPEQFCATLQDMVPPGYLVVPLIHPEKVGVSEHLEYLKRQVYSWSLVILPPAMTFERSFQNYCRSDDSKYDRKVKHGVLEISSSRWNDLGEAKTWKTLRTLWDRLVVNPNSSEGKTMYEYAAYRSVIHSTLSLLAGLDLDGWDVQVSARAYHAHYSKEGDAPTLQNRGTRRFRLTDPTAVEDVCEFIMRNNRIEGSDIILNPYNWTLSLELVRGFGDRLQVWCNVILDDLGTLLEAHLRTLITAGANKFSPLSSIDNLRLNYVGEGPTKLATAWRSEKVMGQMLTLFFIRKCFGTAAAAYSAQMRPITEFEYKYVGLVYDPTPDREILKAFDQRLKEVLGAVQEARVGLLPVAAYRTYARKFARAFVENMRASKNPPASAGPPPEDTKAPAA